MLLLTDRFVLRHGVNETTLATISEKSIAVVPFVNMSDDKANEYVSDGISEELLNLLAKVPKLQVTARTSSFSLKGKKVAIPTDCTDNPRWPDDSQAPREAGDSFSLNSPLIVRANEESAARV